MTFFQRISRLNPYESFRTREPVPLSVGLPRTCASAVAGPFGVGAFVLAYAFAGIALGFCFAKDGLTPEDKVFNEKLIAGLSLIPASAVAAGVAGATYVGTTGATNLFLAAYPPLGHRSTRFLVDAGIRPQLALMAATAILEGAYLLYHERNKSAGSRYQG